MAGEKSKTPADVLARQRAERRVWVALDGLAPLDAEFVTGVVYNLCAKKREAAEVADKQEAEKRWQAPRYAGGGPTAAMGSVGTLAQADLQSTRPVPTPAGTEQQ